MDMQQARALAIELRTSNGRPIEGFATMTDQEIIDVLGAYATRATWLGDDKRAELRAAYRALQG